VNLLNERNMALLPIVLFQISQVEEANDEGHQGRRQGLDRLLHNHRRDQQRRQLSKDYFLEARKVAYNIVVHQATRCFDIRFADKPDVFAMPKMVIQCAVREKDAGLYSLVYKASDSLLGVFKKCFVSYVPESSETSAAAAVAPLLPSLLHAVCADSHVARRIAANWAAEFLPSFDLPVSLHVCSFLSTDVDALVAAVATKSLSASRTSDVSMTKEPSVSFLDLSTDEGSRALQNSLDAEVSALSSASGLPIPASRIVLADSNFDLGKAHGDYLCQICCECPRLCVSLLYTALTPNRNYSDSEVEFEDTFSLACDHRFCCSCWQQYLVCSTPLSASCPHYDCSERVAIEDVLKVAPEQVPRWNDVTSQFFVAGSREHSQCPSPDCPMVARISKDAVGRTTTVECTSCEHRYCFHCNESPHAPARCSDKAEWNTLFASSAFWVLKHTKRCPSCHANIEKNEGRSHDIA